MSGADWQPTVSHLRALAVGLLLAVAGALLRRPDLVVLATPLLVVATWGSLRRPTVAPVVEQWIDHGVVREGETTTWRVRVPIRPDPPGPPGAPDGLVEDVGIALWAPPFGELDPPWGEVLAEAHPDGLRAAVSVRSTRWGHRGVGPARVVASSAWAAFRSSSSDLDRGGRPMTTLPVPAPFDAVVPATHAVGLMGQDRSVVTGEGSEFAGVRPFQAGDRLRRIHWSRSLRAGELHVTTTWADHDRLVVLVVDASSDIGESLGIDHGPAGASSLDTTVRAAGALAEHHLRRGDRVALRVLGVRAGGGMLRVPPATGRLHLRRVLEALAAVEPATSIDDDERRPLGADHGALVVLLSPLVSASVLRRAVALARQGVAVLVIDTLPDGVADVDPSDPFRALAWRIRLLERARELRVVREAGVPIEPWRGPGSLDQVLRDLARRRSAPRVLRR
jgi:uncharacterized protein (DUF58 family)